MQEEAAAEGRVDCLYTRKPGKQKGLIRTRKKERKIEP